MPNHWLMKSDPEEYAITDLAAQPDRTDHWDGVRNHQARNFMRDAMRKGDRVLFYHSGKKPAVMGTAVVARTGYPDHTARDPQSGHFDKRSTPENPVWYMVDITLERLFERPLPLAELRGVPALEGMPLLKKGMRLSIQPVSPEHFAEVLRLAGTTDAGTTDAGTTDD